MAFNMAFWRSRSLWRTLLAGPLAFICAILVMAGAAVWLPAGAAGVNNIVIPLVLFPAIWAALFFYTCLDQHLIRAYLVISVVLFSQIGLIANQMLAGGSG